MEGAAYRNQIGVYDDPDPWDNTPGSRYFALGWVDGSDNLWLFGGRGYDGVGASNNFLNDLWRYDGVDWIFVSGSDTADQSGIYSDANPANNGPGSRSALASWLDSVGNLWLFGGFGYDSGTDLTPLNDLWKYIPEP
jgi:hypothetical protein